jgi:hypothetical protein
VSVLLQELEQVYKQALVLVPVLGLEQVLSLEQVQV